MRCFESPPYIKEFKFYEDLLIPSHKPPLSKLVRCQIIPQVEEYTGLATPKGLSYEGDLLTGTAICILLLLNEELTYIANNLSQTLHVVHYTFYKTVTLILPEMYHNQKMLALIETKRINIRPAIVISHNTCVSSTHILQAVLLNISCSPYNC